MSALSHPSPHRSLLRLDSAGAGDFDSMVGYLDGCSTICSVVLMPTHPLDDKCIVEMSIAWQFSELKVPTEDVSEFP